MKINMTLTSWLLLTLIFVNVSPSLWYLLKKFIAGLTAKTSRKLSIMSATVKMPTAPTFLQMGLRAIRSGAGESFHPAATVEPNGIYFGGPTLILSDDPALEPRTEIEKAPEPVVQGPQDTSISETEDLIRLAGQKAALATEQVLRLEQAQWELVQLARVQKELPALEKARSESMALVRELLGLAPKAAPAKALLVVQEQGLPAKAPQVPVQMELREQVQPALVPKAAPAQPVGLDQGLALLAKALARVQTVPAEGAQAPQLPVSALPPSPLQAQRGAGP